MALLRTYSPNVPAFNLAVGAFLIVIGVGSLLVAGQFLTSSRKMWEAYNLGWLWNDGLMRISHRIAACGFVLVGILIIFNNL